MPPKPTRRELEEFRWLVAAAHREGERLHAELLGPLGVTPSQAEVLLALAARAPLALAELGRLLVCESHSPSRLVDGLVRAGLVSRAVSRTDRRRVELRLTASGRRTARRVGAVEAKLYGWMAETVGTTPIGDAVAVLRRAIEGRPTGEALALRGVTPATGRRKKT